MYLFRRNYDVSLLFVFFFKQKTAYEIVSRDWSSDVCSSDLVEDFNSKLSSLFFGGENWRVPGTRHLKFS